MKMFRTLLCLTLALLMVSAIAFAAGTEIPLVEFKTNDDGEIIAVKQNEEKVLASTNGASQSKGIEYKVLDYLKVARNPSDFIEVPCAFVGRVAQQNNFQGSPDVDVVIQVDGDPEQLIHCSAKDFKNWQWDGAFAKTGVEHLLPKDWVYVEGMLEGIKTVATANGTSVLAMPTLQIHSIQILK